jgi:UDP-N-acetyl-2-amino-2-deoxyglucuronate dehydrogenase
MMATLGIKMEAEDTGVLNIRWRSGTLGSMSVTMLTYPKNLEASLTILGEKGSVKIGGLSANEIQHWDFQEPVAADKIVMQADQPQPLISHASHTTYYRNVAQTLRGEASADIDGREGLRSLEILIAAYIAARDSSVVNLPFVY